MSSLWPVLKILVPKLKLRIQPLQLQFRFNFKNFKTWYMIHSFLSIGSKNIQKKNKNEAAKAKIHAPVLGQNIPKLAIVELQLPLNQCCSIQLWTYAYIRNIHLKCCQPFDFQYTSLKGLDLSMLQYTTIDICLHSVTKQALWK